jgi:quercetin dioxygenase-like cupin family protein
MNLVIKELPFSEAGRGYEFDDEGRNHTVLETKSNAYRGNHTHPYNQYTLLLRGKARYLLHGGERREYWLKNGEVFVTEAGIPHILLPEEDTLTFEWWDGPFEDTKVQGLFEDVMDRRVG